MPKQKPLQERRRDLLREAALVALLAVLAVLLVALVTYSPAPGGSTHLVGVVGRFAAGALWGAFGAVAFALLAVAIYTTLVLLVRRTISTPALRVVGFVMLMIGACTLLHQALRPVAAPAAELAHPFDVAPGGALGRSLFELLLVPFGAFGTLLFSAVVTCSGFAFATDWLLYEMLFEGGRRAAAATAFLRRFWPQPAGAGAGAGPLARFFGSGGTAVAEAPPTKRGGGARKPAESAAPAGSAAEAQPVPKSETKPDARTESRPEPKREPKAAKAVVADAPVLDDPEVLVPAELLPPPAPASARKPSKSARAEASADDAGTPTPELVKRAFPEPPSPTADDDLSAELAGDLPEPEPADLTLDAFGAGDDEDAPPPVRAEEAPFRVRLEPVIAPPRPAELQLPRTQGEYEFPGLDLLDPPRPRDLRQLEQAIQNNVDVLQRTLAEFKIDGRVVAYQQGPVVTMLEVALAPGTKVTKIHALSEDLAMALKVPSVRIVAPIPGKSTVGVEIPNPARDDVRLLTLLESREFREGRHHIPLLLGMRANGDAMVDDLANMPHLLLAGATGAGKSVCINTILLSVLLTRTPDEVRLILVDPKQVELSFFADIPHLLAPVVTDMKRASSVLEWAVEKMEERYDLLRRFEVRSISSYNELGEEAIRARVEELGLSDEVIPVRLPYFVIVVDELADLMLTAGKEVEKLITRLAQKSRAVGIHIILATQRPSTDVITGLIKANMPTRIAFQVTSKVDSRVILDQNGADKLLGMGDMLYLPPRSAALARAQGTFASDKEVKRVVSFLKSRYSQEFNEELVEIGSTELLDDAEKDPLYDEAVRIVLGERRGSASLLQRALAIGYTRASRLLDLMRREGVVGAYKGSKASEVLLTLEEYEERVAARPAPDDENE
mgnify:CR=1 FL=1